jgi:hypothetical protein
MVDGQGVRGRRRKGLRMKLKRLSFIAALFGVGASGQAKIPECSKTRTTNCHITGDVEIKHAPWFSVQGRRIGWFDGVAINGQCPVCGAMAGSYKISPGQRILGTDASGKQAWVLPGPIIVRCANCSNAFWQDAEAAAAGNGEPG